MLHMRHCYNWQKRNSQIMWLLGWFEKNRFLESATYNRWKSGLIPLEHHMQNFSPIGKAPIWALLRWTNVYTHGQALQSPMIRRGCNWCLTPGGAANCRKRCLVVFSGREQNFQKWHKESSRYRGLFMVPSARSGYLCTAPDWKTERRRSEVCKEGAVQRYSDLARGGLKNSVSFSEEVDSAKLPTPSMIYRLLMHYISNMLCHMLFLFSKHAPLSRTPDRCKDNQKKNIVLIRALCTCIMMLLSLHPSGVQDKNIPPLLFLWEIN